SARLPRESHDSPARAPRGTALPARRPDAARRAPSRPIRIAALWRWRASPHQTEPRAPPIARRKPRPPVSGKTGRQEEGAGQEEPPGDGPRLPARSKAPGGQGEAAQPDPVPP